jgi:hypothetical protein
VFDILQVGEGQLLDFFDAILANCINVIFVNFNVVNHFRDCVANSHQAFAIRDAPGRIRRIRRSQPQSQQHNFVEIRGNGFVLQEGIFLLGCLNWVTCQHPLINGSDAVKRGSSPNKTSKKLSRSIWRPNTTRQIVNGVAKINPIGPPNQVQKFTQAIAATGDRPEARP